MRGRDGELCFSEKERGNVWKDYAERIMNDENNWDYNVVVDAVEAPVVCVCRDEVLQILHNMKAGKVPGPEVQFGFLPERGTTDAVSILRRLQEEFCAKLNKCICVLWT